MVRGTAAAVLAGAALAPAAAAAPVTVQVRVEGATRTLFEGAVTTDVRTFRFTDETTEHPCDGTAQNSGSGTSPAPTRGAALVTAAERAGFSLRGTWSDSFGSPTFSEVAGEDVSYDPDTGRYLAEYRNGVASDYGACGEAVASGDEVLFAYAEYGAPALRLDGPATARPEEPVRLHVVDGRGRPVSGAGLGGATTNAGGDGLVTFTSRGLNTLKAEKPGAVRSNAHTVCVTDGADGHCGTRSPAGETVADGGTGTEQAPQTIASAAGADRRPPRALVTSIREGRRYRRRRAPRVLRGTAGLEQHGGPDASGILMVKLRLTRRSGGRCWTWSGSRERFVGSRCGARNGTWFRIGDRPRWEYQLARRLPRGRYVLDVNAIDKAYNRDDQRRRGENRVVFRVR